MLESFAADANQRPSRLKSTALKAVEWLSKVRVSSPPVSLRRLTTRSPAPNATVSALGLKAAKTSCSAFASPGITRSSFPVLVFQNSIPPSWCADNSAPPEPNATAMTLDASCFMLKRSRSDSVGHRQTVPSELPEASQPLSELKASAVIFPDCFRSVRTTRQLLVSHNFTVVSALPEASHLPSPLKASAITRSV